VAVGEYFRRSRSPAIPLIERWNGARWSVQSAPSAPAPSGYRYTNSRLEAVACPSSSLCFAVGQAVAFGAGNAPGAPLIERWNGRRWRRAASLQASGPLTSISCTSTRACTAVGGVENTVGTANANNQHQVYSSAIERWNGHSWSLQPFPAPPASLAAIPLGVSCTSAIVCTAVGSAASAQTGQAASFPPDQAVVGNWNAATWSTQTQNYPPAIYRSPSTQTPHTSLTAVACQTSASCAAVGSYVASNGDIGPLGAVWDGSTWTETVLRRGPVQLASVACPALGWCMAVGGVIAERLVG
jgi:hypothetical protein